MTGVPDQAAVPGADPAPGIAGNQPGGLGRGHGAARGWRLGRGSRGSPAQIPCRGRGRGRGSRGVTAARCRPRRRPRRRRGSRARPRGPASPWPAPAFSRTLPVRARRPAPAAPRLPRMSRAGTAPGRSGRGHGTQRGSRSRPPGTTPSRPRCRCTAGPRRRSAEDFLIGGLVNDQHRVLVTQMADAQAAAVSGTCCSSQTARGIRCRSRCGPRCPAASAMLQQL